MNKEHHYINVDLEELVKYLRDLRIPEDRIKLIIEYCIMRRDKEIEEEKNEVR